ncbi:type II secretion system protein N [Desulfospira joergensenii]|uniref:type II secretion system protein N n=1 Tax=Desulfospira joergensenii TaxID=53329 RepID=UPI0003B72A78|nr:type II secretion system protein N [Desulfospira joergensenii]
MKISFAIIHALLVMGAAYFSVDIMYKKMLPDRFELPAREADSQETGKENRNEKGGRMIRSRYNAIIKRNLFKVDLEAEKQNPADSDPEEISTENLEPTELKLVLWGTVTGGETVFAVIEDKKKREQSLYEIGDNVQEATLKKIMRHAVVLRYKGKDQILEMEETQRKGISRTFKGSSSKSVPVPPALSRVFQEGPGSDELSTLMRQVKIRPHFSDGEADGLMVYGIRPNSVFRQVGLRNGDIIKEINGTTIVTAEDALNLYTEIKEADNAKISLLRRGKEKEILYHVEDGQYVISSLPEQDGNNGDDQDTDNKGDE